MRRSPRHIALAFLWCVLGTAVSGIVPHAHAQDAGVNTVLLIVGDESLNIGDRLIEARLRLTGYAPIVVDDDDVEADDAEDVGLIFISESIQSGNVEATFRNVPVPVVSTESYLFDDLGMTGDQEDVDYGFLEDVTSLTITNPAHPLAAGLSGTVNVYQSSTNMRFGLPVGDAVVVAVPVADRTGIASIFAFETGAQMLGLTAPSRRVGLFFPSDGPERLTDEAAALFDAAVKWAIAASNDVVSQDRNALVALYEQTGGEGWTNQTNWLQGPVSSWYGVTVEGNRVVGVNLPGNNLVGTVPKAFFEADAIRQLDLSSNQLTERLPDNLDRLQALESLNLGHNQFTGAIRNILGNLQNLVLLDLSHNQLNNAIPGQLGNLTALDALFLNDNQLDDTLPPQLGNLQQLRVLHLQNNALTGEVPESFANLTTLSDLNLAHNQLTGLPAAVAQRNIPFTSLAVEDNALTFEDIEPFVGVATAFTYAPQAPLEQAETLNLESGEALSLSVSAGGTANLYQWYKNEQPIPGANAPSFTIESATDTDAGTYTAAVTNTIAPALTLERAPVTVTVENTNVAPEAADDGVETPEDTPIDIDVLANDTDPNDDPLTVASFTQPSQGSVSMSDQDLLHYEPNLNYYGSDSFTYTVEDGHGGSSQATVSISVTPVNDAPTVATAIANQTFPTNAGPFTINLDGVFDDPEDDPLTLSVLTSNNDVALVSIEGNQVVITPVEAGSADITVMATDTGQETAQTTFVVTMQADANSPPRLLVQGGLSNLFYLLGQTPEPLNLIAVFEDPDGDPLTFSAQSGDAAVVATAVSNATLTLTPQSEGSTTVSVTADDGRGGTLVESFQVDIGPAYPTTVSRNISLPFGDIDQQTSYRMVGLPGEAVLPMQSAIAGQPGEDWVAYASDGDNGGTLRPFDGSDRFSFAPGRGFWLLSKRTWTPPVAVVATVELEPNGTFLIPLHPGWNIISNPFDVDVPWSDIVARNNISQPIWTWDGTYAQDSVFTSSRATGEAFYFRNEEGLQALEIPYPGATPPAGKQARSAPAVASVTPASSPAPSVDPRVATSVTLAAYYDGRPRSRVEAGTADEATASLDRLDVIAPPGHFETISLRLLGPSPDGPVELAADYRPASGEGHIFDLVLRSTIDATILLKAEELAGFAGQQVVLIDRRLARSFDLGTQPSLSLDLQPGETRLTLLVGSLAFVEDARIDIAPELLALLPNYPNPFFSATTIEYAIPRSDRVRLTVYDALGRQVRVLVDASSDAGLHRVTWDGTNDARLPAASGLYLLRLDVDGTHRTETMLLLK